MSEDVKKSIPEQFASLKPANKVLALVLITLLAILLFYGIEWWFRDDTVTLLKRKETGLRQTLQGNHRILFNRTQALYDTQALNRQYQHMLKTFPAKSQVDYILKQITLLGKKQDLTFIYFKPKTAKHHGYYVELPINLAVLGSYHHIATFISDVASIPQMTTFTDFTINRPNVKHKQLTMHATLVIYYLPPTDDKKKK